ncbi:hypothetical protein MHK_000796, partial [Candidatus Magnetomorum sp. HK-1]
MEINKFDNNPIITHNIDPSIGDNITGPSLIKVPQWIRNPLGQYYLYFAHHKGTNIRLAYSNSLSGPWKIYKYGALHINKTPCAFFNEAHIASPDIHVFNNHKKIVMYYHGTYQNKSQ